MVTVKEKHDNCDHPTNETTCPNCGECVLCGCDCEKANAKEEVFNPCMLPKYQQNPGKCKKRQTKGCDKCSYRKGDEE